MKKMTVSIIIPAYNEEARLAECLRSIAAQTVHPDEVIVVDNNSTDRTAKIARSFAFVTLVTEYTPGLIAARNAGFAAAHGDVMGRINADVVLDPNWVFRAKRQFMAEPRLAALSGLARSRFEHKTTGLYVTSRIGGWVYAAHAEAYFGVPVLWGGNMLIRRSAWQRILPLTEVDDSLVHEDQDITLCLARLNLSIKRDNKLIVTTPEYSYYYFPKLLEYFQRRHATKRLHRESLTVPYRSSLRPWQRASRWCASGIPMAIFISTSPLTLLFMHPKYNWRALLQRI